jgi:DNA ligase-1
MIITHAAGKPARSPVLQERAARPERDFFIDTDVPVRFIAFDILWLDGETLVHLPLRDRRARLESIEMPPPFETIPVRIASSHDELESAIEDARSVGTEALIAKDPESPYTPGHRSRAWFEMMTHNHHKLAEKE